MTDTTPPQKAPGFNWDSRFDTPEYVFGREPSGFVPKVIGLLPKGARVLLIADGEGRNSVGLAKAGFDVVAMEASKVGQDKARALAAEQGVAVDFRLAKVEDWDWAENEFDAVVGIFIQFASPALRSEMHKGIARTLKPGGLVMLHGYGPKQIEYNTGGPRVLENLYTLELLRGDFPGWEELLAEAYDQEIAEGVGHVGMSALVVVIAKMP